MRKTYQLEPKKLKKKQISKDFVIQILEKKLQHIYIINK